MTMPRKRIPKPAPPTPPQVVTVHLPPSDPQHSEAMIALAEAMKATANAIAQLAGTQQPQVTVAHCVSSHSAGDGIVVKMVREA